MIRIACVLCLLLAGCAPDVMVTPMGAGESELSTTYDFGNPYMSAQDVLHRRAAAVCPAGYVKDGESAKATDQFSGAVVWRIHCTQANGVR